MVRDGDDPSTSGFSDREFSWLTWGFDSGSPPESPPVAAWYQALGGQIEDGAHGTYRSLRLRHYGVDLWSGLRAN